MKRNRYRLGEVGSSYHVFTRGLDRKPLFLDDRDRNTFLLMLANVLALTGTRCFAFALMGNHYHLLLRTLSSAISDVMHRLNTRYALHHNRRHGGVGHVFQGRFQSVLIEDETHMRTALLYVHSNPLRAGLVPNERALRDYRWTGHAAVMGRIPHDFVSTTHVLGWFGLRVIDARRALALAMEATERERAAEPPRLVPPRYDPRKALPLDPRDAEALRARNVTAILGDSARARRALEQRNSKVATRLRLIRAGWDAEVLLRAVCSHAGTAARHVRSGHRTAAQSRARALFCFLATEYLGLSLTEAGRHVSLGRSGASRARRTGERLAGTECAVPPALLSVLEDAETDRARLERNNSPPAWEGVTSRGSRGSPGPALPRG